MYYYILFGLVGIVLLWMIGSYVVVRSIEEPSYKVLEKRAGYEIRQYDAYIIAETEVNGNYSDALRAGFSAIADYIFGNNTTKTSIAMTAPVLETSSEKIAMTVPVISTLDAEKSRTVSFVLPAKYTLETLPQPNNPAVKLRAVDGRKVAVLRFTWYATEDRVAAKKIDLEEKLLADNVSIIGLPQVAQYNPPLSFPFTLRNEIIIPIE
jgi:SOUL heme-binding protein